MTQPIGRSSPQSLPSLSHSDNGRSFSQASTPQVGRPSILSLPHSDPGRVHSDSSLPPSSPTADFSDDLQLRNNRDKRPRPDDDEDEEDEPAPKSRKKRSLEEEIAYKGRRLGRTFHLCVNAADLLEEADALRHRDPATLSQSEARKIRRYTQLMVEYPNIKSDEEKCEASMTGKTLSFLLRKGVGAGRSEDISSLKKEINGWGLVTIPIAKQMRGYNDMTCLRLLSPPNYPLDDPVVVEGIRSLKEPYAIKPHHLPSFLYLDGILHTQDIYRGLFLNELLLRAGLCILRGQEASANGKATKNTGKSIAERHKIKTITPAFIAYVATMLRFVLSNQTVWSNSESNGWKYNVFYRQLLILLEEKMTHAKLNVITGEWKRRIFGDIMDSDNEDDRDKENTPSDGVFIPDLRAMLVEEAQREKERDAEEQRRQMADAQRLMETANRALQTLGNNGSSMARR